VEVFTILLIIANYTDPADEVMFAETIKGCEQTEKKPAINLFKKQ